ncbi:MAG: AgmX/PglI C-terminal domain-containing protein [Sandaracinaceae bacterium]|nr:AgmX/PglI C-terminal domain-containing protein [Sandaracinaceae bacterium]
MSTSPQGPNQGGSQQPSGRAGAMTQAMQAVNVAPPGGPKVLRIGLIQNGKIVEERIIRRRETVSVGTAEKNHFIVSAEGLASRFDLFQLVGDDYILNFTDDMSGRVGLAGGVHDLGTLRTSGGARNAGKYWQVKLTDNSRGKVVIGTTTLLFQFVVAPPVTPKPQLPASARGGFVKSIDWLFTTFVALSFMLFFGFIIWLEEADWEIATGVAQLPEGLARLIFDEPPIPEPETEGEAVVEEGETEAETETETERPRTASNNSSSGGQSASQDNSAGESAADRSARLREEARAQAMALALGGVGGADGAFANALAGGAPTGDAADVIAQANGVGVASGATGGLRTRDGGGRGAGDGTGIGGLAQSGDGGMSTGEGGPVQERVVGRMRMSGGGDVGGSGEFDSRIVASRIRAQSSAIKRCYERELQRNPTLRGAVRVEFTIQTSGAVSGTTATENTVSPAVGSCVVGIIGRLRFSPGPTGGSVRYRFPFVFEPGG